MKQKQALIKSQQGFTVIELLVVFVIMVTVFSLVLVGFSRQRVVRSTGIAQNEMVTNIRKVQSYMLSSRNVKSDNKAVKFYVINFTKTSTAYTIVPIDTNYGYRSDNTETITLNDTVQLTNLVLTNRDGQSSSPNCVQVIFSSPFGKMYIHTASSCNSSVVNVVRDLGVLTTKADAKLDISLQHPKGTVVKTISLYGLSGRVIGN